MVNRCLRGGGVTGRFTICCSLFGGCHDSCRISGVLRNGTGRRVGGETEDTRFSRELSLLNLVLSTMNARIRGMSTRSRTGRGLLCTLREIENRVLGPGTSTGDVVTSRVTLLRGRLTDNGGDNDVSGRTKLTVRSIVSVLARRVQLVTNRGSTGGTFRVVHASFAGQVSSDGGLPARIKGGLRGIFRFYRTIFSSKRRVLVLIARLATGCRASGFVTGCNYPTCFERGGRLLFCRQGGRVVVRLRTLSLRWIVSDGGVVPGKFKFCRGKFCVYGSMRSRLRGILGSGSFSSSSSLRTTCSITEIFLTKSYSIFSVTLGRRLKLPTCGVCSRGKIFLRTFYLSRCGNGPTFVSIHKIAASRVRFEARLAAIRLSGRCLVMPRSIRDRFVTFRGRRGIKCRFTMRVVEGRRGCCAV